MESMAEWRQNLIREAVISAINVDWVYDVPLSTFQLTSVSLPLFSLGLVACKILRKQNAVSSLLEIS